MLYPPAHIFHITKFRCETSKVLLWRLGSDSCRKPKFLISNSRIVGALNLCLPLASFFHLLIAGVMYSLLEKKSNTKMSNFIWQAVLAEQVHQNEVWRVQTVSSSREEHVLKACPVFIPVKLLWTTQRHSLLPLNCTHLNVFTNKDFQGSEMGKA